MTNKRLEFWLSLTFILAVVSIVYYPTLSHMLRGESYLYFTETLHDTTASEMVSKWWNYESVRTIAPGDTMMFRPLLFITIALEKVYFGLDYFWWRLVSMLIHLTAVTCLFRLLWKFKPGILATLMAILFGTSYLALSTILYEQIACYSLFTALLLTGFYYVYQGTETNSRKDIILASLCMFISCFLHESGVVFTGLFILYFWWERKRLGNLWRYWAGAFVGIVSVWLISYFAIKLTNPPRYLADETERLFKWRVIPAGLRGFWSLSERWTYQSLMPAMYVKKTLGELCFHSITMTRVITPSISFIINCSAIAMVGATYFYTGAKEAVNRVRGSFVAFLAIAIIVFMMANSMFRTFTHGEAYLIDHNFNMYMWLALVALFGYICISTRKLNKKFTLIVSGILLVLISFNAPVSYSLNTATRDVQEPIKEYFATIDEFIEEHKDEQDLSFDIIHTTKMQEQLEFFYWKVPEGMSNRPTIDTILEDYDCYYSSVTEVQYDRYWDNENPKYTLEYNPKNSKLEIK